MSNDEIRAEILRRLYVRNFNADGTLNLEEMRKEMGWDANEFMQVINRLEHDEMIIGYAGMVFNPTGRGLLEAETEGYAPDDLKEANDSARTLMLVQLAQVYRDEGEYGVKLYTDIAEAAEIEPTAALNNLHFLSQDGLEYVESMQMGGAYKITFRGLDAVKDLECCDLSEKAQAAKE